MRLKHFVFAAALVAGAWPMAAQSTAATIDIDTATTIPVRPNFSGFNDAATEPIEYWDYHFNALATQLSAGWFRYPGGIDSDAFYWQTGLEVPAWVSQFSSNATAGPLLAEEQNWVAGKGGAKLIDAANRANLLNARIVVDVNAFTDTPQSIGQMAAYAKANGIPVAVWELANEAYNFSDFFSGAADYLTKMRPYRDAIKAADPNAVVAIFARNTGSTNPWNTALAAAANKYWDAVTFHSYPPQSTGPFSQWMADENGVLATETDANYVTTMIGGGSLYLVSEFNPSLGTGGANQGLTTGTLYGGIYAAEFIMRMSTIPFVLLVGPHAIYNDAGVAATVYQYNAVTAAAQAGKSIDTSTLDFGYYVGAQGQGSAIVNGVLKNAVKSDKTTVTGGVTVAATGATGNQMPALYAMTYTNAAGGLSVVITNKSATAHQVTIRVNGTAATGPLPVQYITGADPSVMNSAGNMTVKLQTGSSANPVAVPPYSVLRADLVNPPVATLVNSATYQPVALAPNQLVTAFGSGFASQTIQAQTQPLPGLLGDTTILVTDSAGQSQAAPLFYVSPTQASFLLPTAMAAGAATLKVQRSGATVLTGAFTVAATSPGLYTANGNGAGVAAATALRAGSAGNTALPFFSCQSGAPLSCVSTPLSLGAATDTVYVILYGTGIRGAGVVQAYVAGQSVPVLYAGPQGQFAGLDQVNITLPRTLAGTGEASVYVVADGKMSNVAGMKIQ